VTPDSLGGWIEAATAWNVCRFRDDFLGDTVAGDATTPGMYELTVNNSGTAAILADQPNGVLRATTTGAVANDYTLFLLPELPCQGQLNTVVDCRLALPNIANVKVEFGLLDLTTRIGVVNVLNTPTFTATDGVVWAFDTDKDAYWHCAGVAASTGATRIDPGIAPVAATFERLVIELRDTNARFTRLDAADNVTYTSGWMSGAVTKTVGLSPFFGVTTRTTGAKTLDVDDWGFLQRRTTSS
jgi:hypothetical protein